MKRIVKIGILLLAWILVLPVVAQNPLEKEYNRLYAVNNDAKLYLDNQFGSVRLTVWNKSEIKINVLVSIDDYSNKSDAEKLLEKIQINLKGTKDDVEAITELDKKINTKDIRFSINYMVNVPATIKLKVKNSFGDVTLGNVFMEETDFDISFGSLQVESLSGTQNIIKVKHGSFIADKINNARLEINFSTAMIDMADQLNIRSSFCGNISIDHVNILNHKSAHDNVSIDKLNSIEISSNHSSFNIDQVADKIEAKLDFGLIDIDHLNSGFSLLSIESKHASVEIDLDKKTSFTLEALTRFGSFYVFDETNIEKEKISFSTYNYRGFVGSKNAKSKVVVDSEYGCIDLK